MKKWLSVVLALSICLVSLPAFALNYPVESDATLTIWKVLDGDIAGAGYTTSNETPGFMEWTRATGINVEIQEYADEPALLLAINGASTLPDMFMMNPASYSGGLTSMVNDDLIIQVTEEMVAENAPDYWEYINKPEYMDFVQQLDGNMYFFSAHVFENQSIYRFWRGLIYRGDILQKIGWDKCPETIDEFYQCLVDMKNAGITTPLVFQGNTDLAEMIRNGDITSPFGLVNADEYQVDGKWYYGQWKTESVQNTCKINVFTIHNPLILIAVPEKNRKTASD